jgi:STAS domain-containing protein
MSRPHVMPLLAPEAAGRGQSGVVRQRAARASAVISGRLKARAAARQARAQLACLAVTSSWEGCEGSRLADAIVRRVLHSGCPVGTVVLDLGAVTSLDAEACAAILSVHQRLTAIGTRVRLAASARGLADCLTDAGITQQLGRDAVHPSFRSAVLASYAALPGPGLVLGQIKTALETEAEFISLLCPELLHPLRVGRPGAQRWTVSADHSAKGRTSWLT